MKRFCYVIFASFTHEPAIELAERLLEKLPKNQAKIFYSDNGSTACEVAVKMCFQYWFNKGEQRKKMIALDPKELPIAASLPSLPSTLILWRRNSAKLEVLKTLSSTGREQSMPKFRLSAFFSWAFIAVVIN